MKIVVNLHGFKAASGGVETYVSNLCEWIQKVDQTNEYVVMADKALPEPFPSSSSNVRVIIKDYTLSNWRGWSRGLTKHLFKRDILEKHLNLQSPNVVHHPLTILNPPGLSAPSVLTFHDMQQEFYPEFFSEKELQKRKECYLSSVKEAKAVIAISRFVKNTLVERYGTEQEKVHVIHHGVDSRFRPVTDVLLLEKAKSRYSISRPFVIYPAATWPHKNHLKLLQAIRVLVDQGKFDGELLLTGAMESSGGAVYNAIHKLKLTDRVRFLGYIPAEDLPCLFTLAKLLVFPSLFEGFGLPVIEAMACGCPVACAHRTALPEIAGDSAFYFDPESVSDMAHSIGRLWSDDCLKEEFRTKGLVHAKKFSWENSALQTIAVYRFAATRGVG